MVEGVAVELVHMATLVHDDIVDGAHLRRGRAAAWTAHGADAAKAAGDHLFAAAFADARRDRLAGAGRGPRRRLARARARRGAAAAPAPRSRHDRRRRTSSAARSRPARCSRPPASLGGGSAEFGRLLGIAFQIVDDVLDCTGETVETGKVPGTDLRDGTPTLPLLLAAREDDGRPRARSPAARSRERSCASPRPSALERSREMALDYAGRARESLNGAFRRDELEALADAVVDRTR